MKTTIQLFLLVTVLHQICAKEMSLRGLRSVSAEDNNTVPGIELLRGRDGRDGESGPPGRDGRDGSPGHDGMPGLTGLQGPRGERGEPGPANGPPGPRGLQGERGATAAAGQQGPPGPRSGGVVYTRWGKSSCPSVPGTRLVYAGRAGGSHYTHAGGANYQCMPLDPEYTLPFRPGVDDHSYMYGAEYERPVVGTQNHNVPCAVCLASTRETVLMIPGKTSCPPSWTKEYYGYLMSERRHDPAHHRSTFECVDRAQESIPGSHANVHGARFYHVEAHCDGMQCPPYDPQKELNCVVCTI